MEEKYLASGKAGGHSWRVHPFAASPGKAVFVIIVFAAFAKISFDFTGSFGMSLFALALLAGSLHQFFLPTSYSLDREKIEISTLFGKRVEKLSRFRKFVIDRNGIFLSSEPDSKILDQFRGLFILAAKSDRDAAAEILKGVFEK